MGAPKPPKESKSAKKARKRAEAKAQAMERDEAMKASARLRASQYGGMRLLFSPSRQGGSATTLGGEKGVMGSSMDSMPAGSAQ